MKAREVKYSTANGLGSPEANSPLSRKEQHQPKCQSDDDENRPSRLCFLFVLLTVKGCGIAGVRMCGTWQTSQSSAVKATTPKPRRL